VAGVFLYKTSVIALPSFFLEAFFPPTLPSLTEWVTRESFLFFYTVAGSPMRIMTYFSGFVWKMNFFFSGATLASLLFATSFYPPCVILDLPAMISDFQRMFSFFNEDPPLDLAQQ